jgi:hypothetical protein
LLKSLNGRRRPSGHLNTQIVLDRLHDEVSGERAVRATFRTYLNDWLTAKQAENAMFTMTFYRTSLNKFLQFLGQQAEEPMGEITKKDIVALRDSLAYPDVLPRETLCAWCR